MFVVFAAREQRSKLMETGSCLGHPHMALFARRNPNTAPDTACNEISVAVVMSCKRKHPKPERDTMAWHKTNLPEFHLSIQQEAWRQRLNVSADSLSHLNRWLLSCRCY